jgi:hypothetical protein
MKPIILMILAGLLTACSSLYVAKHSDEPHGYFETKLDDKRYHVYYQAYKSIKDDDMFGYVIKRSAQLAQNSGYLYFSLSNKSQDVEIELIEMPQVMGSTTSAGSDSLSTQTHIAAPGYTLEMSIKTVGAIADFSDDSQDGSFYSVQSVLND